MRVNIRQAIIIGAPSHNDKAADIFIENGVITAIAPAIDKKADVVVAAEGLHVSAGWVDVFADYREPGYEHKETISSGLNAAAAGGFTDVFLTPNTEPVAAGKSVIQYILQKAQGHTTSVHPLGAVSQNAEGKVLAEMLDMHTHGAIAFTDGWKPVQNTNLFLKALEYAKAFNGVLLQIPVDNSLASGGLMHEGTVSTRLGMAGIPTLAETLFVHRDIELLRYTNGRLHITGLSSAESVAMIRRAKADGLDVTCSVTPYHLALTDEALAGYDSLYKVSPPLRTEADRQALIVGLADGTIDCIATHHRPHEWDAKAKEYEYAADGMNIQEVAFNVLLQATGNQVALGTLINALTTNPRRIFGLQQPVIAEGSPASLTLFSRYGDTVINRENKRSAGYNNPFAGILLPGSVIGIINNNNIHLNK
ncbi:MAG: dihydroorotase [Taibaiella sp.]|nr:dihydroorotase [Taibaiella sp.]